MGPLQRVREVWLVLDTGSPVSILSTDIAILLDLTADRATGVSRLLGPTGKQDGYKVPVKSLSVMGKVIQDIEIHCHDLEPNLEVDGVVGLDILQMGKLTLDTPQQVVEFEWAE